LHIAHHLNLAGRAATLFNASVLIGGALTPINVARREQAVSGRDVFLSQ
jgi:hypothetical protein